MARAEAFVLSSRWEGWPNAMVEALACGCPVVAFDCSFGPREIIEHEVTGLLVPEGDVPALAADIHRILENQELATGLRTNGRKLVKSFDVRIIARRWLHNEAGDSDTLGESRAQASRRVGVSG